MADVSTLPTVKLDKEQVAEFSELARQNLCEDCYQRMMVNLFKNGQHTPEQKESDA